MRKLSGYGPSLIVLATAMLVLFLGPTAVRHLTYKQTEARRIQAVQRLRNDNILEQINQAYRDIAAFVEPSVVHISARQSAGAPGTVVSTGSGWVYDEDGHIVTNYHVVAGADPIDVQLSSGEIRQAGIVGFDRTTDIAVLKIPGGRLHPAVRADAREAVIQGDLVFAFGSPFDFRFSMSSGIVSGKGRFVGVIRDQRGFGYESFIQVDAAINPGNSGGPLTDFRGRVIGMNTAIATGTQESSLEEGQFAGVGLAIPLEMIEPAVSQIIAKGYVEKGYLGVTGRDLDPVMRQNLGFTGDGVRVHTVEPGTPADEAGVQPYDIITGINEEPVATMTQLQSVISSIPPGGTIELTIWRPDLETKTGQTMNISVRLARLDALRTRGELPLDQSTERIPQLGIARMSTSSPELAEQYGVEFHRGVLIERVVPGSYLEQFIDPGATILLVEDYRINNVEEFVKVLRMYDLRAGRLGRGGVQVGVILADGRETPLWLRVNQ